MLDAMAREAQDIEGREPGLLLSGAGWSEQMAEEVGFEPTVRFPARRFSRPVP